VGGQRESNTQNLKQRLAKLAEFVSFFETDGFKFAEMRGGKEIKPGLFEMPWSELSDPARRFYESCYADGWVLPKFDWSQWGRTREARDLLNDTNEPSPGASLAKATPEQLAMLLTALIRNDRFCEGYLHGAFDSGLLLAIVRRARELAEPIT
jgi:Family of unknown function (DUF6508)